MAQNYEKFLDNKETAQKSNKRLNVFIAEYQAYKKQHNKPLKVLDIGCGRNPILAAYKAPDDIYFSCDYYESIALGGDNYHRVDLNKDNLSDVFQGNKFDVIFCGEVMEHLFSPDHLLQEIKKVMHPESILILSTPNLGYYLNRLMLLVGLSPFFLENSSEYKFGRGFRQLGQMNSTEGHIRLFTFRALKEFVLFSGFKIDHIVSSTGPWDFFLDSLVARFSKSLSATNVFVLKIKD